MKTNTFREVQYFTQWWIWLLVVIINAPFFYGIIWQVFMGNAFGNNPMSDIGLIVSSIFILLFSVALLLSHLTTYINEHGIHIKFTPFNLNYKFYDWEDIRYPEIISYKPLIDFGGYGIRHSSKRKAYIVKGTNGLQLELKNGKKLLIGTQMPEKLKEIIEKVGTINEQRK